MTPVLRDRLHWLRAPQRIQFKVALLVYKAINNLAPDYITIYCRPSSTNDRRSTVRSADKAILIEPKIELNSERSRSHMPDRISAINYHCVSDTCRTASVQSITIVFPTHAGPHQCNVLPLCVRHMPDRISAINYHCVSDTCRTASVQSITIVCPTHAGPHQCNLLPLCVRQSPCVDIFKTRLKTFLFSKSYCD